jgi:hypothetical protein
VPAEFLPEAAAELDEAFNFYETRFSTLGYDFKAEARHALDLVVERPRAWKMVAPGIRQCRLNRFPYALVYGLDGDRIVIIAVAHLKRRPKYWRIRWARPRSGKRDN